ncbi:hypothetical protein WOLCODRAFT_143221 [Wolfiporia cocos MD-104 SS10]|uniref:CCHC-type domain-containing protein n=1 Tax=Wolfiporia cocos (strain MD-104) TaxID=742152 RepID=A0A2H3JEX4_WOLCO|nr:hypothetical protein WOLCODRAFT_143221 [Wolfiporia cocos MD-104 SS10]
MTSTQTEIIDLTASSPPPEFIALDSDGEVIGPDALGSSSKARQKSKRKNKKRRALEDGEIAFTPGNASKERLPERYVNGAAASGSSGSKGKSLLERLSSPPRTSRASRNNAQQNQPSPHRQDRKHSDQDDRPSWRAQMRERRRGRERERDGERRSRSPERRWQGPAPTTPSSNDATDSLFFIDAVKAEVPSAARFRERDGKRRSRSPERCRQDLAPPTPSGNDATDSLFFIDVVKAEVPLAARLQEPSANDVSAAQAQGQIESQPTALLLPAHISVLEGTEEPEVVEILPQPKADSDDESYIEYMDYDNDQRVRYFEQPDEDAKVGKPRTVVCKNCGAEGEHQTYECPVLICLTCGVRDEHPTRSCPISKTCFACGMKGHINRTCPNRHTARGLNNHGCDRCGSEIHNTNECPTLWRLYEYVDDAERQNTLRTRAAKRDLPLGEGGEGYIATDEWCYNCGGSGHLGDDCQDLPRGTDVPVEPSAFGSYSISSGPFADTTARPSAHPTAPRAPRDWEVANAFADGWGANVPMDIGKQGRQKERERLGKRARELEEEDPDDWFSRGASRNNSGGGRNGGRGPGSPIRNGNAGRSGSGKRISFGFAGAGANRDDGRRRVSFGDLPGPARKADSIQIRGVASHGARHERRAYDHSRDYGQEDSRRRDDRGPRYRGGYSG